MKNYMLKKGIIDSSMDEDEVMEMLIEHERQESGDDLNRNTNNTKRDRRGQSRVRASDEQACSFNNVRPALHAPFSDTTIYKNAVEIVDARNISSSSGGMADTSDENLGLQFNSSHLAIAGPSREPPPRQEPEPSTSGQNRHDPEAHFDRQQQQHDRTPQDISDELIRDVDRNKARMMEVPGNMLNLANLNINPERTTALLHSVVCDDGYLTVAAHIDEQLKRKILNFEYVDFSRLLPHDRVMQEEDGRLAFVNKGGVPYLVPASDGRDRGAISSYPRWDQAFRVYCDIITSKYPTKSTELIQYNHSIYTASQTFAWNNVYAYDKDFRLHIARNPMRTWAVILQQAWSMRLKDRQGANTDNLARPDYSGGSGKKDYCRQYQWGKCQFGLSCRYEHRCAICNKFGHGADICRRRSGGGDRTSRSHYEDRDNSGGDRYHYYGHKDKSKGEVTSHRSGKEDKVDKRK